MGNRNIIPESETFKEVLDIISSNTNHQAALIITELLEKETEAEEVKDYEVEEHRLYQSKMNTNKIF